MLRHPVDSSQGYAATSLYLVASNPIVRKKIDAPHSTPLYWTLTYKEIITGKEGKMPEMHDVAVKVISQKGSCSAGHKVGDEWVIKGKTPAGICLGAFNSLSANLRVLMFGGTFSWSDDPDTVTVACPDAANPVVFELKRAR